MEGAGVCCRKCLNSVASAGGFSVSIANGGGRNDPASPGDTSSLPQATLDPDRNGLLPMAFIVCSYIGLQSNVSTFTAAPRFLRQVDAFAKRDPVQSSMSALYTPYTSNATPSAS